MHGGDLVPPAIWYPGVPNECGAYNVLSEMVPPGEMVLPYNPAIYVHFCPHEESPYNQKVLECMPVL